MRRKAMQLTAMLIVVAGCGDATGPELLDIREIQVTPLFSNLPVGYGVRLFPTLIGPDGNPVSGGGVAWKSSDPGVATVLSDGTVRGVSPGQAEITAGYNGVVGRRPVTVVAAPEPVVGPALQWTMEEVADEAMGDVPLVVAAVWGSSPADVFAVGDLDWGWGLGPSRIVHYTGTDWRLMHAGGGLLDTWGLLDIWGTSASDVYAVGGQVLHYDGTEWSEMTVSTDQLLASVWGSSGEDVFAAGGRGVIVHYDGQGWSTVYQTWPPRDLAAIWGSSASDVFAVGRNTIVHWDGGLWRARNLPGVNLTAVWGTSSTDVFAVGDGGTMLHYDGAEWSAVPVPPPGNPNLLDIGGTAEDDIFALGQRGLFHFDGTFWRPAQDPGIEALNGLWVSPEDVFLTGWGIAHGRR